MSKKSYFAGLEGFTAKFVSMVITVLFYVIYTATSDNNFEANWFEVSGTLILYTLLYEGIGFILFTFFKFFSRNKVSTIKSEDKKDTAEIVNFEKK